MFVDDCVCLCVCLCVWRQKVIRIITYHFPFASPACWHIPHLCCREYGQSPVWHKQHPTYYYHTAQQLRETLCNHLPGSVCVWGGGGGGAGDVTILSKAATLVVGEGSHW